MRALAALALAAAAAAVLGACRAESDDSRAQVVVTTTQAGDLARQVVGNRARVRVLLRPGADPHDYEPRPSDARAIAEAAVVIRSGGELDEWSEDLIDSAGGDADVVDLSASARPRREGGDEDPHWWQDPRNAVSAVGAIERALAKADTQGAAGYQAAADAYAGRLRRLDSEIARCMAIVPPELRKLVTTHDAFGYFADRYDVEVVGALIPALSSQAQPSAGETARLVDQIRDEGVRAIFPERALDPRLERAVARETGAYVGRALWADSLGPADSDGATYVEAMASDTAAMVEGMTGAERRCRPRVQAATGPAG